MATLAIIKCNDKALKEFLAYCQKENALPSRISAYAHVYEHLDNDGCKKCADKIGDLLYDNDLDHLLNLV